MQPGSVLLGELVVRAGRDMHQCLACRQAGRGKAPHECGELMPLRDGGTLETDARWMVAGSVGSAQNPVVLTFAMPRSGWQGRQKPPPVVHFFSPTGCFQLSLIHWIASRWVVISSGSRSWIIFSILVPKLSTP